MKDILQNLTIREKAALLQGWTTWTTRRCSNRNSGHLPVRRPHGLRKQAGRGPSGPGASVPATCFPTAATMANTWDAALGEELGKALGRKPPPTA